MSSKTFENPHSAPEKAGEDPHAKGAAAALHHDSTSPARTTPKAETPDTHSKYLSDMKIVHGGDVTRTEKRPGGNEVTETRDRAGLVTDSKTKEPDGSTSQVTFNADGTTTMKYSKPDGSNSETTVDGKKSYGHSHEVQPDGSYKDVTVRKDGSATEFEKHANGDSVTKNFKDGHLEDTTTRTMNPNKDGGYVEKYSSHGKDSTRSFDKDGKEIPNAPKEANRPAPPASPTDDAAQDLKDVAKSAIDNAKGASFVRNSTRVAVGSTAHIAAEIAKDAGKEAPAIVGALGAIGKNPVVRAISPEISPVLNTIQIAGGVAKMSAGDPEGKHDVARGVISWGVGSAVGLVGLETGPLDIALAGGAGIAAGQAYDAIRDPKPITYPEAKEKHDSSWFYKLMEPNENNWAN